MEPSAASWSAASRSRRLALALAAIDSSVVVLGLLFALVGAALVPALPILLEMAERRMPEVAGTVAAVIWLAGNLGVGLLTGLSSALYTVPAAAFLALAAAGGLTAAYTARKLTSEIAAGRMPQPARASHAD